MEDKQIIVNSHDVVCDIEHMGGRFEAIVPQRTGKRRNKDQF